jgi:hypothetical protein
MDFGSSAKTQGVTATLIDKNYAKTRTRTSIDLLNVKRLTSREALMWLSSNIGFNTLFTMTSQKRDQLQV